MTTKLIRLNDQAETVRLLGEQDARLRELSATSASKSSCDRTPQAAACR